MRSRATDLAVMTLCACARAPAPTVAGPSEVTRPVHAADGGVVEHPSTPNANALVRPCEPGDEAAERAVQQLAAVSARIEGLAPTDDPTPAWAALQELLEGECFALHPLVGMYSGDRAPTSGLSLQTWWTSGGASWVGQFLELHTTWQRPSVREVFAPELLGDHPLADMFCAIASPDCDPRTRGWKVRAWKAFEDFAELQWVQSMAGEDELPPRRDWGLCRERAEAEPAPERYAVWTRCIDRVTLRQSVFPIGDLREPEDGWFVVRGRRGHHNFCDEIRVYDLATGSAHVVASCSGLALREDGSVDGRRTDDGRVLRETSGRVPVDALREAVWMALWSTVIPSGQVLGGSGFPLSDAIEPMGDPDHLTIGLASISTSSGQTTLDWTYVRDGHPPVTGDLRWPENYNDAAKDHAVRLLRVAEKAMVESCAPRRVPSIALRPGGTGVSHLDANPASLDDTARQLERMLTEKKPRPNCRRGP